MRSLFRIRACSLRLGLDGMLGDTGFSQKILPEYPVNLQVSQLPTVCYGEGSGGETNQAGSCWETGVGL